MRKAKLKRMSDSEILLYVVRTAIRRRRRETTSAKATVNWKRDNLLHQLEAQLIAAGRMKKGYVLNQHGKRHFTCLLGILGRQTKTRPSLIVISGPKHNREMGLV